MNDLDELLQERLARLEAGEPLATAGADLPEETTAALNLAAALQELKLPEAEEAAVTSQRAAVLRAARQAVSAPAPGESTVSRWLATWQNWWRGHQAVAWGLAAAAAVLLLLFTGSRFLQRNEAETAVVERPVEQPDDTSNAPGSSLLDQLLGRDEAVPEAVETSPPEVAGQPEEPAQAEPDVAIVDETDLGFKTYLPFLIEPLAVSAETAVLGDLQGVVSVQKPDGSWEQVSTLTSVAAGSRVRTGALSSASLTFFDGSVAKLGPDSELAVDSLNALRPEDGFRTVVLTQWRGNTIHDVQFRNDNGSRYEVLTPSGTGIARGTTFMVSVLADLTSRYTVLEGRVDVTSINVTVIVQAGQLSTIPVDSPPSAPQFQVSGEGEVTQTGETWIIGGQSFATDEQTVVVGNPQVGDWVTVQGHLLDDGSKVADEIVLVRALPQDLFRLTAVVTEIGPAAWQLGDVTILVNAETAVDPDIELGDWVRVTGVVQPGGNLLAQRIQKQSPEGTPFEFTGVVQEIGAEVWLISGIEVTLNGRTEIKNDPEVGDIVKVEGQITPDDLWLAREIKAEDDDDDDPTFEFTGLVETVDPWLVAGIPLITDDWTEIEDGIEPGDRVKVEGVILADGTWLAQEIKLQDDRNDAGTIVKFAGVVESVDPLVVNGITLLVTDDSRIDPEILVGDMAQVAARLTADGRWVLVWIRPLLPPTTGCFTIHALVTAVTNSQITLANWPALTLDDNVAIDGTLLPNSIISLHLCQGHDQTIQVVNIIVIQLIININPPVTHDNDDDNNQPGGSGRVTICHVPPGNPDNRHTITVGISAWENEHSRHGDTLGPCGSGGHHDDDDDDDDD